MTANDKLSAIMFYKEQDEECYWCDLYWETYLKVARKLKSLMHFYVLDCEDRRDYESDGGTAFSIPQCNAESDNLLPFSMLYKSPVERYDMRTGDLNSAT